MIMHLQPISLHLCNDLKVAAMSLKPEITLHVYQVGRNTQCSTEVIIMAI